MNTYKGIIISSILLSAFFFLSYGFPFYEISAEKQIAADMRIFIRKKLIEAEKSGDVIIRGELIHDLTMVSMFYQKRDFQPAWSAQMRSLPLARDLIDAIKESYFDGLTPEYYHLRNIEALIAEERFNEEKRVSSRVETLVNLDFLLTDAFFLLSCHLSSGCVNPVVLEAEWFVKSGHVDVAAVLDKALRESNIRQALKELIPPQDVYLRLRQALMHYHAIDSRGGWPAVSEGPLLKKGVNGTRVIELKNRLAATGDIDPEEVNTGDIYDKVLEVAVRRFQQRHGLDADGVVGNKTLNALNIPVEIRVRQIELNLERLRWSLRNLGERYILVNIADFSLNVVEDSETVLSMKVVVGKPYWHTPVFSAEMTYLVLNPFWNVPDSIASQDILPEILKDPDYLIKENIKVLRGWENDAGEIDPATIDWKRIGQKGFPYRFRQEPGPQNPLGQVKFMFPNTFSVYLHDSPQRRLFEHNVRTFSHGCIRIEKPIDLLKYLLRDDQSWTDEDIRLALDRGTQRVVRLAQPIKVHLFYLTAWVNRDASLQFREDVYGRDKRLADALQKRPPSP